MEGRSVREIIREELKKLSGMSWGERLGYIWDYYKPLMVAVLVVIGLISMGVSIYHNLQINHLLTVYYINCDSLSTDSEAIQNDFAAYLGGIGDKDEITVDASTILDESDGSQYGYASQMKFTTLTSAAEIDVVIFDEEQYERYTEQSAMMDLGSVLTEEQLEEWSDLLMYGTDGETGEEIVSAIDVTDSPLIQKYNSYQGEKAYACIMVNSTHPELAAEFLAYMMN